jgi:hypothetical protein
MRRAALLSGSQSDNPVMLATSIARKPGGRKPFGTSG